MQYVPEVETYGAAAVNGKHDTPVPNEQNVNVNVTQKHPQLCCHSLTLIVVVCTNTNYDNNKTDNCSTATGITNTS